MDKQQKQQEFVLRTLEERDIRFVRLWFTDVLGFLKQVAVAPAELEAAFSEGIGFDGSAIEGFARVYESDMLAKPDPSTFQILPWRSASPGAARIFCDILMPDGTPSYADPRYVLKRALARASELGFTFYCHPEIEFFLFEKQPGPGEKPVPIDPGGYFDYTPHRIAHDFRRQAITMLEAMGISVEFSHHEGAPGQQEIDLRYADALTTADNIMTFRLVMKEVALEQGVYASFMPKPFTEHPGSGMHTHVSLFEGDRNAFYEPGAEYQLSKVARSFIAGLLRHAGEITAVTNQWVNSYKRLLGGGEAPAYICWGHNNRSALVRVPMYKPQKGQSTRVEIRSLDSACNPYLAFAVILAAGLKGVEEGYELPPGAEDDVWSLTDAERRALGIEPLPQNLNEAIKLMERSELVAETLGEHVFDFFLRNKRAEWEEYRRQVTAFERDRYLPVL
ncbi:glutamine synthetase [Carbonactinospora thermoautotrophica]|uniref:Glutamine synthetase n=1 Tax=Carbonactinospora thermoautotrophica TaxID=1469144 RepID=A0A132MV30_9ACTN|nr:glutamine synthetase family protein [Carbonactinospora thermoautotrophica]KWX00215.1 glutamine synthetase [Carbonactinospora thermoautotrophica]KWX01768.1 Glutamine synthetase type I [Carbonactinospora thermoautotrophica]KWX10368.1 glutamine synthetase [Carbonactinospora thermoautotrophica]MCX9190913.1 glutamine synthetase [Carbonactinospora thermoautotrophica]